MLVSLVLAGLTGFLAHKKKYGWAVFTGLLFFIPLWLSIVEYLNAIVFQKSMGF